MRRSVVPPFLFVFFQIDAAIYTAVFVLVVLARGYAMIHGGVALGASVLDACVWWDEGTACYVRLY